MCHKLSTSDSCSQRKIDFFSVGDENRKKYKYHLTGLTFINWVLSQTENDCQK